MKAENKSTLLPSSGIDKVLSLLVTSATLASEAPIYRGEEGEDGNSVNDLLKDQIPDIRHQGNCQQNQMNLAECSGIQ